MEARPDKFSFGSESQRLSLFTPYEDHYQAAVSLPTPPGDVGHKTAYDRTNETKFLREGEDDLLGLNRIADLDGNRFHNRCGCRGQIVLHLHCLYYS
jgi:hypothetical protein